MTNTILSLASKVTNVPNFPTEGIQFKDITTLLEDPKALNEAIKGLVSLSKDFTFNKIICADSRGFIFGPTLAFFHSAGVVLARKPGKLPRPGMSVSYTLEYGSNTLEISAGSINPGDQVLIVDDLLATGGSAKAMADLVKKSGGTVVGAVFLIELIDLKGSYMLECPHRSILNYGLRAGLEVECNLSSLIEDDQQRYSANYQATIKNVIGSFIVIDCELDLNKTELLVPFNLVNKVFFNGSWRPFLE